MSATALDLGGGGGGGNRPTHASCFSHPGPDSHRKRARVFLAHRLDGSTGTKFLDTFPYGTEIRGVFSLGRGIRGENRDDPGKDVKRE